MNNDINEKIVHAAPVPPFVRFVASAVPMVFDNSLSYYEALCALWKWLQDDVIDVINNNATVTEHYIEMDEETRQLFIELKSYVDNYFDNLDVQEEINNKLDDMVEAGTLQEIITSYLQANVAWTFNTVADMKSSTNLVDGSYAQTLGFRSANDGGGAIYKISDSGTANERDVIALSNSLYAHYVDVDKQVTPEQFGAYGDGIHNDTEALRTAASYASSIMSLRPAHYRVSLSGDNQTVLAFNRDNITIKGNNAKIELANNAYPHYNLINFVDCKNFHVCDLELIGDRAEHDYSGGGTHEWGYGIFVGTNFGTLQTSPNCYGSINNVKIHDMTGDAIATKNGYATGQIEIVNCELYKNRRQGVSILDSDKVIIRDTYIHEIGLTQDGITGTAPTSGIDIEPASGTSVVNYVSVENCNIEKCYRYAIVNANDNTELIEVKNTKLGRPLQIKSNVVLDNVDLDFADSSDYYASNTDFGLDASEKNFKYSTITVRGANKQLFNGHHLHVKGVIINDTWGANNAPKLPSASNIYDSIFEKMLITTGDADTTINPSVLNGNKFISCQFHNSGKALVFTNCTFINCTKYSFNTSTQRTFINCYFDAIPDANMKYKGCYLLDGTAITDNL